MVESTQLVLATARPPRTTCSLDLFRSETGTVTTRLIDSLRKVLPFMIATLSAHGTAIMLEGVLLARKQFAGLAATYVVVCGSIAAFLGIVRSRGLGLSGVWLCYVWYCLARAVAFAALGGLLSFRPPAPLAATAVARDDELSR